MSLKDNILAAANARKGTLFPVKAWGEDAFIRIMTGTERDRFEASVFVDGKVSKEKFRAKVLVRTLADDAGARLFTDEEVDTLSEMDGRELNRLYDIASKENGLTKDDEDELVKNS